MSAVEDGGPAYPAESVHTYYGRQSRVLHTGMTLRDYFAGQALQAAWDAKDKGYFDGGNEEVAECAYLLADAMIAARSRAAS